MMVSQLLKLLASVPEKVEFSDVIEAIDGHCEFSPSAFRNGEVHNAENENNGSCKIFAFARLHDLSEAQTLHCFGTYYRDDVLKHPDSSDHQNIRQFMQFGWQGIDMPVSPLRCANK